MIKLVAAALVAIVIIYLASNDWRRSVKAVLFIVVIEGVLRKWILPQANELIYFLKDLVLIGAYLRYFLSPRDRRFPIRLDGISILIVLIALWVLYEVFNPSLGSPIIGLFGAKNYVLYLPLIWMVPILFQSEQELQTFLQNHLLLAIPSGIVGAIQYVSPKDSFINAYAPNEGGSQIATFGSAGLDTVRITGFFSYINSYQGYLIATFALLLPMLALKQSQKWRFLTLVELVLVLVNTLMTGSRTPLFAQGVILLGYLGVGMITQSSMMAFWIQRVLPSFGLVGLGVALGFRDAVNRFWRRVTSNNDLQERISQNFGVSLTSPSTRLDGYGVGATFGGTGTLRNLLGLPPGKPIPLAEAEMSRITIELGPLGFLLWYSLRVLLIVSLWFTIWRVQRPFLKQLAIVAFFTHLVMISGQLVFNHTFAVYYWFMSGFIFLLPQLEANEYWYQQQQIQQLGLQPDAQASYLSRSSDGQPQRP